MDFNRNYYPNYLDKLPNYSKIREKLAKMSYTKPARYDSSNPFEYEIEEGFNLSLPRFNNVLLDYINRYNDIPTCSEFCEHYFNTNRNFFAVNKIDSPQHKLAIRNRCMRAYPSLLRDILFGKYLQSKGVDVIYNVILDSKAEIDLMIIADGMNYGVHLFTNTARANAHRRDKEGRYQTKFDNVKHIDLGINLSECAMVNNLGLYEEKEYNQLMRTIYNG